MTPRQGAELVVSSLVLAMLVGLAGAAVAAIYHSIRSALQ